MRRCLRYIFSILALAGVSSVYGGSLQWDQTTITTQAKSTDSKIESKFSFTNKTDKPVTITNIRTSCGCTTAALTKREYLPGESGTISVIFTLGGRKGLQEKSIIVESSGDSSDMLTMRVKIPDSVKINKEQLTWEIGDPSEEQAFDIEVVDNGPVEVKSVRATGDVFDAKLVEVEKNKAYRVLVKPLSTDRPVQTILRLEVADPNSRTIFLPVQIRG